VSGPTLRGRPRAGAVLALGAALLAPLPLLPAVASAQLPTRPRRGPRLSIEPYAVNTQLDDAVNSTGRAGLNGYGVRLSIRQPARMQVGVLSRGGITAWGHWAPERDGNVVRHLGVQQEVFVADRPILGFIDPVVSLGAGAYRLTTRYSVNGVGPYSATRERFALTPGAGVRLLAPGGLHLRLDARDAVVFNQRDPAGRRRTLSNVEFTAGLGLTF
jgi:hypothetical protein